VTNQYSKGNHMKKTLLAILTAITFAACGDNIQPAPTHGGPRDLDVDLTVDEAPTAPDAGAADPDAPAPDAPTDAPTDACAGTLRDIQCGPVVLKVCVPANGCVTVNCAGGNSTICSP
jgi:hypothetical protein